MEETQDTQVPVTTVSESSDQEAKFRTGVEEKQKAILSLGRDKARVNRENKTKAKLDSMLEGYLK